MRVCLIGSSRYPVCEPYAGGLEALVHQLARELIARGHEVTLFAAAGTDPRLPVTVLEAPRFRASDLARRDVNAPSDAWMAEHHAYLALMLDLARDGARRFDVVHNHSLHHLPIAMAPMLDLPLVTTLHTPPLPWLESAVVAAGRLGPGAAGSFTAVSRSTARAWSHAVASVPILNGVDVEAWAFGSGGGPVVWSGRLVPEKAPHEAILAARRAGRSILLAGPAPDRGYFEEYVAPLLGPDAAHVGHLDHPALARLLAHASVAVVTPAWDEPFGLVAAEAMSCGTPVAAYAQGALLELVVDGVGALARPGDPDDLARAIDAALGCDRRAVREHAVRSLSIRRMVDEYLAHYAGLVHRTQAA